MEKETKTYYLRAKNVRFTHNKKPLYSITTRNGEIVERQVIA
jgi:hypothetical protein